MYFFFALNKSKNGSFVSSDVPPLGMLSSFKDDDGGGDDDVCVCIREPPEAFQLGFFGENPPNLEEQIQDQSD